MIRIRSGVDGATDGVVVAGGGEKAVVELLYDCNLLSCWIPVDE